MFNLDENSAMPVPTPNSGESQKEFISRCMEAIANEFDSQEQRLGVCYTQWRESNE
jgi:hypothetical protein